MELLQIFTYAFIFMAAVFVIFLIVDYISKKKYEKQKVIAYYQHQLAEKYGTLYYDERLFYLIENIKQNEDSITVLVINSNLEGFRLNYQGEIDLNEDMWLDTGQNFNIINLKKLKTFDFDTNLIPTDECKEILTILEKNDLPKMKELNPEFHLEIPK